MSAAPALTAEHCAVAIVWASRETGEDPLAVAQGLTPSRARTYAFYALRECFPGMKRETAMALAGAPDPRLDLYKATTAKTQARWWSPDALARIADAVRGVAQPPPTEERTAAPAAAEPKRDTDENSPTGVAPRETPARRAQGHRADSRLAEDRPRAARLSVTSDLCGDPAPGRSAYDRRLAEQALGAAEGEPDGPIAPLSSARLRRRSTHA